MRDPEVAERYAEALYEIASEEGLFEEIGGDLSFLVGLWRSIPELPPFLEHPLIPVEEKERFFERALGGKLHPYTLNFLRLLARKGRLGYLPLIQRAFLKEAEKGGRVVSALLRTARPVDEQELEGIKGALEGATGRPVVLETELAPELLAGAELWVGGKRYDHSLRRRLEALAEALEGETWREGTR